MVQPGDFVLAIGNPLGFEETVTDGIISSKGRPNRSDLFASLLQTNAAINPGNSGGPLINLRGEVIGINTVIASTTGGSQGLGFAIPSNTVRSALESLLKQGRIIRGYLGIQTGALQRGAGDSDSGGVTVGEVVSGSPAEQAGLQPGDRWCLCAPRWQEAFKAGQAPRVVLRATHEGALAHCALADLKRFAVDID